MARTTYPRTGAVSGQNSLLHLPRWSDGAGLRGVMVFHGVDAQSTQAAQGYSFGSHPNVLADAGYAVMAVDLSNPYSWPSPAVMTIIDNAYTNLISVVGGVAGTTKVGIMAWSCGGADALNWIKRNATKVSKAWLFNPLTDMDYAHSTAGYTPAYGSSLPNNATWTSEIDTMFSNNYAVNAVGYKIRDEYSSWAGLNIPIVASQASSDTTVPPAATTAFVNGVNDANVTLRSYAGGHSNLPTIPTSDTLAFFTNPTGW
jgi:hypothetical protein